MKKRIPVLPVSLERVKRISEHFLSLGEFFSNFFPSLSWELEKAELDFENREWAAIGFFAFLFYFLLIFGLMFVIMIAAKVAILSAIFLPLIIGFAVGFVSFLYVIFYPKLTVSKKVGAIEKNLPYVLHHLLIELRSGVPLYDALESIAKSNYGMLSKEIEKTVKEIKTGKSEVAALEMLARKNPSLYFRRILWQMVNTLKSGADIGSTVKNIVDDLAIDQRTAIKKYGAQLNPLALMYMIFAVIFPTLGITFLLVISSFVGVGFNLELILVAILGFLVIFQFMLIGLIKSRRPSGV